MKKVFLSIALFLTILIGANAGTTTTDAKAKNNFSKDFREATNATWITNENYCQVSFDIDDRRMNALYTPEGELIGISTAVAIDKLPVKAKRAFAKKYADYTVLEAQKFDLDLETAYYVMATKEAETVIIKLNDYGDLSVVKKTKK